MAFEKYIEIFKDRQSEKNGMTLEQKEQFKKERTDVFNIINELSDKWKKLCIEFLTYNSSKFEENNINWENEQETAKIKKIFNIIKWRNYHTKARLANQICTQYRITSILLNRDVGEHDINHDRRTLKRINYMNEKWRSVRVQEFEEEVVKPRAKNEKQKEEKKTLKAMKSWIYKIEKIFHDISDEWKEFCIEMLKKSNESLMESTIIVDDKEQKYQEETQKLKRARFHIMLLDEDLKKNLINKLSKKYNIAINKENKYNWPRKLVKRKKINKSSKTKKLDDSFSHS